MVRLFTLFLAMAAASVASGHAMACTAQALSELKRLHPPGYTTYTALADKKHFTHWITCDDLQTGLATAVHESVHLLAAEWNAYPLLDGRHLARVDAASSMYPPRLIAGSFSRSNAYVETYLLPGQASSSDDFGFLLDEMNAYGHDLHAAIALRELANTSYTVSHRDGLAALMAFVFTYTETARASQAGTWAQLKRSSIRETITALWEQSERVMNASCTVPNFGEDAAMFLTPICEANLESAIAAILGRPPACPVRCVRPAHARVTPGSAISR